jgi:hypothetical protein
MVARGSRLGAEASPSHACPPGPSGPVVGTGQGQERVDAPSPLFVDAQEEQQLWEELRGHGASLNQALNVALQIHGGPAWCVFQVHRRPPILLFFFLVLLSLCSFFTARCSLVSVCWWQELELRTRNRYGALDQMSPELCQLRKWCDALDALAEALRTRDGWMAYRVEALRDQLLELEGQSTARPSTIERVRTALNDRD